MSQQPEAIRLADLCDLGHPLEDDVVLIGPELRRLHADNKQAATLLVEHAQALATLRAQVERLQAAGQAVDVSDEQIDAVSLDQWGPHYGAPLAAHRAYARVILALRPIDTLAQEAADTGVDWPKPSQWDSPLSDFQDGQWWVKELDSMASAGGTPDQKRAVAVVHHLLRAALAARGGQVAASSMVPLSKRIVELILEHGTLRAVSRALSIDVGYLSRLEHGEKVSPSPEVLAKLGLRDAGAMYERLTVGGSKAGGA